MFGNARQQAIWQHLTVHHTNIFRESGSYFLVLIRALLFGVMIWLTHLDIKRGGIKFKFFSVWGAQSTLYTTFLFLLVSLQKVYEQAKFQRSTDRAALAEEMVKQRNWWYFNSFTAWMFQFSFISELSITICFWVWLFVLDSDMSKMSSK